MMRSFMAISLCAILTTSQSASAASCTIEDWRYSQWPDGKHIKIDGRTSCRSGRLSLTLYDGNGEYIGSDFAFIRGHVFDTFVEGQAPKEVRLKYDIEPR